MHESMERLNDFKRPRRANEEALLQKGLTNLAPVQLPTLAARGSSICLASAAHRLALALLQAGARPFLMRGALAAVCLSDIYSSETKTTRNRNELSSS